MGGMSPASLKSIADAAHRATKPLTLCGEIGGRPLEAMTLVALGYRGLSMSPASIGPVKAVVRAMNAAEAAACVTELLAARDGAATLRPALAAYAQERDLPL